MIPPAHGDSFSFGCACARRCIIRLYSLLKCVCEALYQNKLRLELAHNSTWMSCFFFLGQNFLHIYGQIPEEKTKYLAWSANRYRWLSTFHPGIKSLYQSFGIVHSIFQWEVPIVIWLSRFFLSSADDVG